MPSNEMAGIIVGINSRDQLPGDILNKEHKVLLFHGQHRWKALIKYCAIPGNHQQNYWPVRIYSDGKYFSLCIL